MPDQFSFPGMEPEPRLPRQDRLFFAVHPDAASIESLSREAQRMRREFGLQGAPLKPENFHVTLNHLDDFSGLPDRILGAAREAGAAVSIAPFDVCFDRAMSFRRAGARHPLVLTCSDEGQGMRRLQQALAVAMARAGLGRYVETSITPHLTLLYDEGTVAECPVEPIRWTVRELVLIHSLLGRKTHIPVGRWLLSASA